MISQNKARNTSPIIVEGASSTTRKQNMNGENFRTIQDQNSSSLRESNILKSNNISNNAERRDSMKIYRGPFSVS